MIALEEVAGVSNHVLRHYDQFSASLDGETGRNDGSILTPEGFGQPLTQRLASLDL